MMVNTLNELFLFRIDSHGIFTSEILNKSKLAQLSPSRDQVKVVTITDW